MTRTRLLLLAFVVSLGLNLFFVGGIAYRINRIDEFSGRPLPPNVNWMVRDLSEARRAELQPFMQSSADEILPVRLRMFEAQRRANELMANPVYDAALLDEAFTELRNANLQYQEISHQHSVAVLNQLTESERRAAVELINRRGPRDGRDRRNSDGPSIDGPQFGGPPIGGPSIGGPPIGGPPIGGPPFGGPRGGRPDFSSLPPGADSPLPPPAEDRPALGPAPQ